MMGNVQRKARPEKAVDSQEVLIAATQHLVRLACTQHTAGCQKWMAIPVPTPAPPQINAHAERPVQQLD